MDEARLRWKVGIFKGLAHPVRLAIVERLASGERCVCEIAAEFSCDRTTISKHLALLKRLGIIEDRKEGLNVYYSLRLSCLGSVFACLDRTWGEGTKGCVACRRHGMEETE